MMMMHMMLSMSIPVHGMSAMGWHEKEKAKKNEDVMHSVGRSGVRSKKDEEFEGRRVEAHKCIRFSVRQVNLYASGGKKGRSQSQLDSYREGIVIRSRHMVLRWGGTTTHSLDEYGYRIG